MRRLLLLVRMGLRNVLRYRRRSIVSSFAIIVSVFVMMCLRGLVNGSETMAFEQMVLAQHGAVQIHKKGFGANVSRSPLVFAFSVDEGMMKKIRAVPGVRAAAARIPFAGLASSGDKTVVTPMFAIDPDNEYKVCPLKLKDIRDGKPVALGGSVMSPQLRRQLGLELGSELTLVTQDQEGVMNAALLNAGGFLSDVPLLTSAKKLLFVPLASAQELLRIDGMALEVAVSTDDYVHPEGLKARLEAALGPDYEVEMWRDRAALLVDSLNERRVIFNYITGIFLFIALIGITNTMLMNVLGRTGEIGTMMAVGMKRWQIICLFIAEAAVLGIFGSALGIALGESLVSYFYWHGFALTIPGGATQVLLRPFVEWQYVARIGSLVAAGCAAASIYPAIRASRLNPIQAMSTT
jgi:putative ABC transport system permease protein